MNNRIDPSMLALPSVNLAKMLPVTTDPCGYYPFSLPFKQDEQVYIGKVDYVRNDKHTIFTRYTLSASLDKGSRSVKPTACL